MTKYICKTISMHFVEKRCESLWMLAVAKNMNFNEFLIYRDYLFRALGIPNNNRYVVLSRTDLDCVCISSRG